MKTVNITVERNLTTNNEFQLKLTYNNLNFNIYKVQLDSQIRLTVMVALGVAVEGCPLVTSLWCRIHGGGLLGA